MTTVADGERDLATLLRSLRPVRRPGTWVWASVPADAVPAGARPDVVVVEDEGTTLVVRREEADALGLAHVFPCAWLTLRVHSALDAVGLTAAVAGALTEAGISANVVAGRYHDHLLVPEDRADEALAVLNALAEAS